MNASPADLAAPMANLSVGKGRKKRPARAYHNMDTLQAPSAPAIGNTTGPYDPNQFAQTQGSDPYNGAIGGSGYPAGNNYLNQQFAAAPGAPMAPMAPMSQAPTGPMAPTQTPQNGPHTASINITNPRDMASQQTSEELTLAYSRHRQQEEFSTPQFGENGEPLGYKSFFSFQNVSPLMAGTQYHAVDQGTSTPKFIRSTMYNMPESENLRRATKLPVAISVRPFAPLLASEDPVPVVDMSTLGAYNARDDYDVGPPRCNRCRTFINPSMTFSGANRFVCNICQFPNNSVPNDYSCVIDPLNGFRLDKFQRPELHKGVYDIILPNYYNVNGKKNELKGYHHVFVVDVSHQSIKKGLPAIIVDALRAAIFELQEEYNEQGEEFKVSKFKYSILLFDKKVHFFNVSSKLESAQLVLSPDLEDPFVPFHDGLFADPNECALQIEDALNKIEDFCNGEPNQHDAESCLSVALRSAMMCLEQVGGGKITAVLSSISSWGPGRSVITSLRNVGRAPLAEEEKKTLAPSNKYYQLLAKDMVAQNVAVDIFAICDTAVDMANIGWLASVTGGQAHKWVNFLPVRDGRAFCAKIFNSVHKTVGYQGLFKLRCSTGLQVLQYYGFPSEADSGIVGYSNPSLSDPTIPVLTEDQTFTVLLEYDGVLKTSYDCHFQASILYTDAEGIRKIRVINLVTSVSERLNEVFAFVDQEAVAGAILRDTLSFVGKQLVADLRRSVNEKIVDVFAHYRMMSQQSHQVGSNNEFLFPESMKHFALFMLAIIKTKALRDSASISDDIRLCDLYDMMYMPIDRLSYHLCPAMVELHSLTDDECMVLEDEANVDYFIKVPKYMPLTETALEKMVYILCNGSSVFVRIHPESNIALLQDLFGDFVRSCDDIDPMMDCLPELPTLISQQARNIVKFFNRNINGMGDFDDRSIIIVRDGVDLTTHAFKECLVEDKLPSKTINTSPNYVEFLASVHKAIGVKLQNDKLTKKDLESTHVPETLAQRFIQM